MGTPEYHHQYYQTHKDNWDHTHKWRKNNPDKEKIIKRRHLLKQYGLTIEAYETMLKGQDGGCAICGGPPGGKWNTFNVDHDHKTGKVRGLLCLNCNRAIGCIKDNPKIAQKIVDYLNIGR